VESTARMELAEASRRVKRELESTILEFGYFRRMTQQSITDALDEVKESIGQAREQFAGEITKFSLTAGKPFEDASKRSGETLEGLNRRTVQVLEVSKAIVEEGEQLTRSTTSIVTAMDALVAKLLAMQSPDHAVEARLAPLIQGLTQAIAALNRNAESQAKSIETNLKHTQSVVVAVTQLLQEIRSEEETARPVLRPLGSSRSER
jgi:hypothetical protein